MEWGYFTVVLYLKDKERQCGPQQCWGELAVLTTVPQFPLAVHHPPTSGLQLGGLWERRSAVHPQTAASIFREGALGLQMRHGAHEEQQSVVMTSYSEYDGVN